MVSDVTRMGEWSPECVRTVWDSGEPGVVGSRFVGSNYERHPDTGHEWKWDMVCEVVVAERPSMFRWTVLTEAWDKDTSVWTFDFEERGGDTAVTQTFAMRRPPRGFQPILDRHPYTKQVELIAQRRVRLEAGMQSTLAALKFAVETTP